MPKQVDFISKAIQNPAKGDQNNLNRPSLRYSISKIETWTILREKVTEKLNVVFLEVLHKLKNNRLCDVRNDKYTIQQ